MANKAIFKKRRHWDIGILSSTFHEERTVMIRKMSHATIFVNNQNEALEFYRDKLGFKVHTVAMGGPDFRAQTINPISRSCCWNRSPEC